MLGRLTNSFSNWWNHLTGQGSTGDHGGAAVVTYRPNKTSMEIGEILRHSPLMRIACEAMAEDIVRVWRTHSKNALKWTKLEEEFELRDIAERAMFFAEGFGGCFVVPRYAANKVKVEDLAKPKRSIKDGFLGFELFTQFQLRNAAGTEQMRQPNGLPMFYMINDMPNVKIHHSWIYEFHGPTTVPSGFHTGQRGSTSLHCESELLGQSRVDMIHDDFARAMSGYTALSHLLIKGNIDVLSIEGLAEAMSRCDNTDEMSEQLQLMIHRASTAITGANTFRPMVVDNNERLERKQSNNSGVAEIVRELLSLFIASTRIPRTRLLGEQAKGLNNGGDADLSNYYDRCATYRERKLTRFLNWMDNIVAPNSRTGWEYNSLWELSGTEKAALQKNVADVDKIYSELLIPGITEAITKRLGETGQYALVVAEEVDA